MFFSGRRHSQKITRPFIDVHPLPHWSQENLTLALSLNVRHWREWTGTLAGVIRAGYSWGGLEMGSRYHWWPNGKNWVRKSFWNSPCHTSSISPNSNSWWRLLPGGVDSPEPLDSVPTEGVGEAYTTGKRENMVPLKSSIFFQAEYIQVSDPQGSICFN